MRRKLNDVFLIYFSRKSFFFISYQVHTILMLKMCRENKPFVRIIDRHLIEGTNGCKLNVQHNDNVAKSTHTYILHIPNDTYTYTHKSIHED